MKEKENIKNSSQISMVFSTKQAYKNIRGFLAGRFVGATRDESLLHEVIKFQFCRLYIDANNISIATEDAFEISNIYRRIFSMIKEQYPSIFRKDEEILLDPTCIEYIHQQLKDIDLLETQRDPIGDAYEIFIGNSMRGQEGQFFTPKNAVRVLVSIVNPKPNEKVLDLACGAGGFLTYVMQHYKQNGYTRNEVIEGIDNLVGIDKDDYLSSLAKIHLASYSLKVPNIICADSIAWDESLIGMPRAEYFDVILTNPPFGSNIVAGSIETLMKFDLAYKWKESKCGTWGKTNTLQTNVPPQVLFIEQCIKLVKPGGRIGIVVPESLISNKKYVYVVDYIRNHCSINAVMGMPEDLFKTSGKSGTHTKTCLLVLTKKADKPEVKNSIFFAEAEWCGHDSRGREIPKDDLVEIERNYLRFANDEVIPQTKLGYIVHSDNIINNILAPRNYDPTLEQSQDNLKKTHMLVKVSELINDGTLSITTGDEVGKLAYGTGNIPFVRTSDISNWEIKIDPKQGVSEEIFNMYKNKQDVRPKDILMVRDGTYLIGTCAMITEYDTTMVYQSHLLKIRVNEDNKYNLNAYLLLAILSCDFVLKQIKSKTTTQDIIDSIGNRIGEIILPIPKDKNKRDNISKIVEKSIIDRIEARELSRKARIDVLL